MPENIEGSPQPGQVDQSTSATGYPVDNDTIQALGATALKTQESPDRPREDEEPTREQDPNRAAEAAFSSKDMLDKANAYETKGLKDLAERTRRLATEQEEWAKEQYDKQERLKKEIAPDVEEKMEEVAQFVDFPYPKPLNLATVDTISDGKIFKRSAEKWKARKTAVVEEVARRLGVDVSDASGIAFRHPASELPQDQVADIARRFGIPKDDEKMVHAPAWLSIREEPTAVENIRLRKITSLRQENAGLTSYQLVHVAPEVASRADPQRF